MLGRAQGAFHYPWTKCHLRREEGRGSQASCPVHHCSMALPGTAVPRTNSSLIFFRSLSTVMPCPGWAQPNVPACGAAMGLPSWQETLTVCEGSQSYHAVSEAPGFTLCHAVAHHWAPAEHARQAAPAPQSSVQPHAHPVLPATAMAVRVVKGVPTAAGHHQVCTHVWAITCIRTDRLSPGIPHQALNLAQIAPCSAFAASELSTGSQTSLPAALPG